MKFYVTKQKSDFLLFKCPEKSKFVSPETGDEFRVDDVVGGSEELLTLSLLQCCNTSVEKTCLVAHWKVETMCESDDRLSSVNLNSSYSSREESVEPPSTLFPLTEGKVATLKIVKCNLSGHQNITKRRLHSFQTVFLVL